MIDPTSAALINVWHSDGSLRNGPTLSSLLGIVSVNCEPDWEVKVNAICAGSEATSEHGIPYVPASPEKGLMLDEMSA